MARFLFNITPHSRANGSKDSDGQMSRPNVGTSIPLHGCGLIYVLEISYRAQGNSDILQLGHQYLATPRDIHRRLRWTLIAACTPGSAACGYPACYAQEKLIAGHQPQQFSGGKS